MGGLATALVAIIGTIAAAGCGIWITCQITDDGHVDTSKSRVARRLRQLVTGKDERGVPTRKRGIRRVCDQLVAELDVELGQRFDREEQNLLMIEATRH